MPPFAPAPPLAPQLVSALPVQSSIPNQTLLSKTHNQNNTKRTHYPFKYNKRLFKREGERKSE